MLHTTLDDSGSVQILRLSGTLDESFDLHKKLTTNPPGLHVYCGGIERVNSTGMRAWIALFNRVAAHTQLKFFECSPFMVEQINMIRNFVPWERIVSVQVPYECPKCGAGSVRVMTTAEIVQRKLCMPHVTCGACGAQAEFDDIPNEYFCFLKDALAD